MTKHGQKILNLGESDKSGHQISDSRSIQIPNIKQDELLLARKKFLEFLPDFRRRNLSVIKMKEELEINSAFVRLISVSSFLLHIVRESGAKFLKSKIVHRCFQPELKSICRPLTTHILSRIIPSQRTVLFYDETTFTVGSHNQRNWFGPCEKNVKVVDRSNLFLKVNLVVTLEKVVAFFMSFEPVNASAIDNFLKSVTQMITKDPKFSLPVFIVMDNGPKNRSKSLTKLTSINAARFVYTTPTTPEHNFIEVLFGILKRKVLGLPNGSAYVYKLTFSQTLLESVFSALKSLDSSDFEKSRSIYLYELSKIHKI